MISSYFFERNGNVLMRFDEFFVRRIVSHVSFFGSMPVDPTFSVDSRAVTQSDVFVALKGGSHDGHSFIIDALKNGASGALIALERFQDCIQKLQEHRLEHKTLIAVPDPYEGLMMLAAAWRKQFAIPIIGITGSVGKTSAKEGLVHLFTTANISHIASRANQNTRLGAALNLLRLRAEHTVGIFEMGTSRRGEMALLAKLVKPTVGVITSIGHSHMEGLGSLHDIAVEKRDIFKYFSEQNIGIVNGDQPLLASVSYPHPVMKCGSKTTNQIQVRKVRVVDGRIHCVLKLYKDKYDIVLEKPHIGAVTTMLVVAAIAHVLAIDHKILCQAVQQPIIVPGRFERLSLRFGRGALINDCYNANPESMKAALAAFQEIETKAAKVAVLGDMLELGVNGPFWHRQIGRFFRKAPSLKRVILVGNLVKWVEKTVPIGVRVDRVHTWQDAKKLIDEMARAQETLFLVKGSNGVGLLNLVKDCTN